MAVTISKCKLISETSHKNNQVCFFWMTGKRIFENSSFFLKCFEIALKMLQYYKPYNMAWLMRGKRNSVLTMIDCDQGIKIKEILVYCSLDLTLKNKNA